MGRWTRNNSINLGGERMKSEEQIKKKLEEAGRAFGSDYGQGYMEALEWALQKD